MISSNEASIDRERKISPVKARTKKSKVSRKKIYEGGEGSAASKKGNSLSLDPRFSKGEILRENTKKSGLKSFMEDKM
jgi:hypothetical protein